MKKILLAIFLIVGVFAVSVGYVLFSQPAPEGNGSKTVYDYERLEPFPFDIQDGEMRDTVGCLRRLHSDTRYLVRLRFRVTGSPLITLEIVDSCMPTSSAISRRTKGFIAFSPSFRKACCRSMMLFATLSSVSLRLCKLLMNQRASCRWLRIDVFSLLLSARLTMPE